MDFPEKYLAFLLGLTENEKASVKAVRIVNQVQTHNGAHDEAIQKARKNNLSCPCCKKSPPNHDDQFNTCPWCKHVWLYLKSPEMDLKKELAAAGLAQMGSGGYRYKLLTPGRVGFLIFVLLAFVLIFFRPI